MNPSIAAVLLISTSAFALAQPQRHDSTCQLASFAGHVNGGQSFDQPLGNGLVLRLGPLKDDWGWQLTISLEGSDDDWAYPVNPPLRFGNSEYLGTGYGLSAREVLSHPHEIRFPLTSEDYSRISKLAIKALWPGQSEQKPGEAATAYLDALKSLRTGAVILSPVDYDKGGEPEKVGWMKFNALVIVPQEFRGDIKLKWTTGSCTTTLPSEKKIQPK